MPCHSLRLWHHSDINYSLALTLAFGLAFRADLFLRGPPVRIWDSIVIKIRLSTQQAVALWTLRSLSSLRTADDEIIAAVWTLMHRATRERYPYGLGIVDEEVKVDKPVFISLCSLHNHALEEVERLTY